MALPYLLEIQQSISSALLLRVQDTDASVLNALYTSAPEVALRVFLTAIPSPVGYLDALKQALHGSSAKPSRDVIRAHLSFLLSRFLPGFIAREEDAEASRDFLRQASVDILLPFLLYTKPRMKTAQAVWEILQTAEDAGTDPAIFELLGGCVEAVRWEQQRAAVDAKEKSGDKESINVGLLTKINIAVAAKIAGACSIVSIGGIVLRSMQTTSLPRTTISSIWIACSRSCATTTTMHALLFTWFLECYLVV